jgi:hypothetical protein
MKIAIQISGLPRFTKDIEDFLINLHDTDQVDWFFYLWNNPGDPYVPPNWPCNDIASIRKKISNNLPQGHNIVYLRVHELPKYEIDRPLNLTPWSNPQGIWYMFNGIKQVNQTRVEHNESYDLVIRTRGDLGISTPVSCIQAKQFLDAHPSAILMPDNHRLGVGGYGANDLFAIGLPNTITLYASAFDKLFEYNDQGTPYHPETLLAHHLVASQIATPPSGIQTRLRHYKQEDGTCDWGHWN